MLSADQKHAYERDGYLVLRDVVDRETLTRLDTGLARNPPLHGFVPGEYPAPGRYTLAHSCFADPDLAPLAEYPPILAAARDLLGDDPVLTAFVAYDRTPGGAGIPGHNDYKRWRPVGSSLNWLFTIVPMTDFTPETGVLYVAPGSHRLERMEREGRIRNVAPCITPAADAYVDPALKRGDLLLMNMHLWHKADPNRSGVSRVGFFNKYAARHAVPATGYYVFSDAAYNALSDAGKSVIAVHSDLPVTTTRALLERERDGELQYLAVAEGNALALPGGATYLEQAIPDWDIGNYIAPLMRHLTESIRITPPWLTYVGDFREGDGLCRVYAYPVNDLGFPVSYEPARWVAAASLDDGAFGYESEAIARWRDPTLLRGKGVTQAQGRIDQYAF